MKEQEQCGEKRGEREREKGEGEGRGRIEERE